MAQLLLDEGPTIITKETFCHLLFSRERSGLDPPIVAAMRFMIALAATGINQSTVLFEFIHNKWRFWIGSIPVYSIFSCLFCWKVADWRFICVTAAVGSGVSFVGLR